MEPCHPRAGLGEQGRALQLRRDPVLRPEALADPRLKAGPATKTHAIDSHELWQLVHWLVSVLLQLENLHDSPPRSHPSQPTKEGGHRALASLGGHYHHPGPSVCAQATVPVPDLGPGAAHLHASLPAVLTDC